MTQIINSLIAAIGAMVSGVLSLLPQSPFIWDMGALGPYMGMINYFVPFNVLSGIMATYVAAVLLWYAVRWALRFARYIN